jgi:hypothetical protein
MLDGDRVSQNLGWWCSVENIRLELFDGCLPVLVVVVGVAEALHVLLESIPAGVFLGVGYHEVRHFGLDSKGWCVGFGVGLLKELVASSQTEDLSPLLIQKLLQA